MKICLIGRGIPRIPPKSTIPVTIYIHTLAQQFCLLGHSVDVVCGSAPSKEKQIYNIIRVGKLRPSSRNFYIQTLYELWYSLCLGLALKKLHRQNKYDVICFLEAPAPAFFALLLTGRSMPPFIFHTGRPVSGTELAWGNRVGSLPIRAASDAMHSYVFKRTKVIVSSGKLRDTLVNHAKINPHKDWSRPLCLTGDRFIPSGHRLLGA